MWASVHGSPLEITIFYEVEGLKIYARGQTVQAAVRDLAAKINSASAAGKRTLDAVTPLLPTN